MPVSRQEFRRMALSSPTCGESASGGLSRDGSEVAQGESELQARLNGDHAWRAIAAQTDPKQAGRGRGGVSKRSESGLGERLAGNAG